MYRESILLCFTPIYTYLPQYIYLPLIDSPSWRTALNHLFLAFWRVAERTTNNVSYLFVAQFAPTMYVFVVALGLSLHSASLRTIHTVVGQVPASQPTQMTMPRVT